jgi:hypothetical protein
LFRHVGKLKQPPAVRPFHVPCVREREDTHKERESALETPQKQNWCAKREQEKTAKKIVNSHREEELP